MAANTPKLSVKDNKSQKKRFNQEPQHPWFESSQGSLLHIMSLSPFISCHLSTVDYNKGIRVQQSLKHSKHNQKASSMCHYMFDFIVTFSY